MGSRRKKRKHKVSQKLPKHSMPPDLATNSLLDKMVEGREFESILKYKAVNLDLAAELKKAINDIEGIRNRPLLCYLSNVVNSKITAPISIDGNDDLPFSEMVSLVPSDIKEVDIMLVTPGGSAQQVAKFVDKLRPRFDGVSFLLPNIAMSAGTIFAMSGDEIIMDDRAYIGPVDPQIPDKNGRFVPAQAILTLIKEIKERGEQFIKKGQNPPWTDLQILNQIDGKEIGNAISASEYSIELVETYLHDYKFKQWNVHSDGRPVTDDEKKKRAREIAELLCDHSTWKTHSRGINRDVAWDVCKLKITHPENIAGLHYAIRKFWALMYWVFENTPVFKVFASDSYYIFRHDISLLTRGHSDG